MPFSKSIHMWKILAFYIAEFSIQLVLLCNIKILMRVCKKWISTFYFKCQFLLLYLYCFFLLSFCMNNNRKFVCRKFTGSWSLQCLKVILLSIFLFSNELVIKLKDQDKVKNPTFVPVQLFWQEQSLEKTKHNNNSNKMFKHASHAFSQYFFFFFA